MIFTFRNPLNLTNEDLNILIQAMISRIDELKNLKDLTTVEINEINDLESSIRELSSQKESVSSIYVE